MKVKLMFSVLPRATFFIGLLVIALNFVLVQATLTFAVRKFLVSMIFLASMLPGMDRERWSVGILVPLFMWGCCFYFNNAVHHREHVSLLYFCGHRDVRFLGLVVDAGLTGAGARKRVVVEVREFIKPYHNRARGRLLLLIPKTVEVHEGDYVVARGEVKRPYSPKYPWDFSVANFLERFGATAEFFTAHPGSGIQVIQIKRPPQILDAMRESIKECHRKALGAYFGDLLTSMVIGNRNVVLDESITSSFRNLGLSHMVAASGFNLSIVVGTTWAVLKSVIRNRILLNLVATAMMVLYSELAGISASIERAMIMCAIMLFTNAFTRTTYLPATLAWTLCITLFIDPFALSDVGLQLSYFATASLVCTSPTLQAIRNNFRNGAIRYIIETCLSCLSAVMSVLPLQLYYFWQTGLLQVPANALVSPMVPIITIQGFATSALACVNLGWLVIIVDQLAGLVMRVLMLIVAFFNSCKWSVVSTGPPPIACMVVYYASLILLFTCKKVGLRAGFGAMAVVLSICALFYRPPLPPLTVIKVKLGVVVVDSDRHALIIGDDTSLQVKRCVAYHGASSVSAKEVPTGATRWFSWKTKGENVVVTKLGSEEELAIPSEGERKIFSSVVRVFDESATIRHKE